MYPCVKKHESKRDGRGAFYAIHCRWLCPNHVNATTSEAELAFWMSMYSRGKNAWNWEKYVAQHVKCHSILRNLMEYGYQGLHLGSKDHYLLNGIWCDKWSIAATSVRAHPDKPEKDFKKVVIFPRGHLHGV